MERLKRTLAHLDDGLAVVTLAVIVLVTVAGVFMRYVVGDPLKWTEEVSKALVVWFTFLGASTLMRTDAHVSIDVLVRRLPGRLRYAMVLFRMTVMTAVLLFLVIWGTRLLAVAWVKITPVLHVRYTWIDLVVPCTAAAMIVHLFRAFHRWNARNRWTIMAAAVQGTTRSIHV
jgi:TRAP-type C4-dicarboxylate transport system permease small subunit